MKETSPQIAYSLFMPAPHTHYFEVSIHFSSLLSHQNQDFMDITLPVWTPGSYLIREYARHVESFRAEDQDKKPLKTQKTRKNSWRVFFKGIDFSVSYKVYAFDLSVRTSYLDESHAYLNGASIFMFAEGLEHLPASLHIHPYTAWTKISTPLSPAATDPFVLAIPNYDVLVDSPIEIGTHEIIQFEAEGVLHKAAIYGLPRLPQPEILVKDIQSIVRASKSIFGELPVEDYTFIILFTEKNGGGLEHANATSLQFSREKVQTSKGYRQFLSLLAHEYFHLWNVKRLRPYPLGPFDYNQENYTTLLWQAEGFTSYYERLIMLKAGLISTEEYLSSLAESINYVENQPGNQIQSLSESSLDAWIKAYRPHENSANTTVSYYTKGAVIAFLLDLTLIYRSEGRYSLDEVMQSLYQEYYKKHNRGFSEEELQKTLEHFTGQPLEDFFEKYIHGTEEIDYAFYLDWVGLELIHEPKEGLDTGMTLNDNLITFVKRDSCAYDSGLQAYDKIVSINGQAIEEIAHWLSFRNEGETLRFQVIREGLFREIPVTLRHLPVVNFKLSPQEKTHEAQQKLLERLLRQSPC